MARGGVDERMAQRLPEPHAAAPSELGNLIVPATAAARLSFPGRDVLVLDQRHIGAKLRVRLHAIVGEHPPAEVGHDPSPRVVDVAIPTKPGPPVGEARLVRPRVVVVGVEHELDVGQGAPRVRHRGQGPVQAREPGDGAVVVRPDAVVLVQDVQLPLIQQDVQLVVRAPRPLFVVVEVHVLATDGLVVLQEVVARSVNLGEEARECCLIVCGARHTCQPKRGARHIMGVSSFLGGNRLTYITLLVAEAVVERITAGIELPWGLWP